MTMNDRGGRFRRRHLVLPRSAECFEVSCGPLALGRRLDKDARPRPLGQ